MVSFGGDKHPRLKALIIQKKVQCGGLAVSNIMFYYHVAILHSLLQWWNPSSKQSWEPEQEGLPTPLSKLDIIWWAA